jgi:hypothetical protein
LKSIFAWWINAKYHFLGSQRSKCVASSWILREAISQPSTLAGGENLTGERDDHGQGKR